MQIHSEENPRMLRELQSNVINQLVVVPGIIISMGKAQIKATQVIVRCSNCEHEKRLKVGLGFQQIQIPRSCDRQ